MTETDPYIERIDKQLNEVNELISRFELELGINPDEISDERKKEISTLGRAISKEYLKRLVEEVDKYDISSDTRERIIKSLGKELP